MFKPLQIQQKTQKTEQSMAHVYTVFVKLKCIDLCVYTTSTVSKAGQAGAMSSRSCPNLKAPEKLRT